MDPLEFPFDVEAYKKQSEIEDKYIINRFRERRNKIEEDYAARSKRKYFKRDHAAENQRLIDDYFANRPTYDDAMFRQRFRMRKHIFLRIVEDLSSSDNYFTQRSDAAKKEGISPLAKCMTAMRMLAYGVAANAVDEYIKIRGTTALECLRRFCKGIIRLYEQEYLRAPTQDDLKRILHVSEMRGFSGMIGSIDCMHWEWKIVLRHGKVNLLGEIRESPLLFLKQLHLMIYGSGMLFWVSGHVERYKCYRPFTGVR